MADKNQKIYKTLFLILCAIGVLLFISREVYVVMADTSGTPVMSNEKRKMLDSIYMEREETNAQLQIFKDDTPGVNAEADSIKTILEERLKKLDSLEKH
jgi:uncharacterized protein YpmS